ncbi:MAG TPA: hypothetical protein VJ873_07020, partial [bacterium]|nr:hypothetical protein [bacterium]
ILFFAIGLAAFGNFHGKVQAATLSVCPSGCTYTTFYAAELAAASGDTISISGPTTETQGTSSTGSQKTLTILTNGSPQTININANLTEDLSKGTWTFNDIVFNHLTAATSLFNNSSTAAPLTFTNCGFISNQADAVFSVGISVKPLSFNQCFFIGGASSTAGISIIGPTGTVYIRMQNSIVRDVGSGYAVGEAAASGLNDNFYFCDFVNNLNGLFINNLNNAATITDCIFESTGTTELAVSSGTGKAVTADYCTFSALPAATPPLGLGTHNYVSAAASEFVNATAGSEDLHLLSTASSKGHGLAIGGITTDYPGVTRNTPEDIGAYAYLYPTPTATPTNTPTATPVS